MSACTLCGGSASEHNGAAGPLIGPVQVPGAENTAYVHRQCALWSPEVYQSDRGTLKYVGAAIRRGRQIRCSGCGQPGATLGCRVEHCSASFHLWCAFEARCQFNVDRYVLACPTHRRHFKSELPPALVNARNGGAHLALAYDGVFMPGVVLPGLGEAPFGRDTPPSPSGLPHPLSAAAQPIARAGLALHGPSPAAQLAPAPAPGAQAHDSAAGVPPRALGSAQARHDDGTRDPPRKRVRWQRELVAGAAEEHVAMARYALAVMRSEPSRNGGAAGFGTPGQLRAGVRAGMYTDVITLAGLPGGLQGPGGALDVDEVEWAMKQRSRVVRDTARLAPIILAGAGGRAAGEAAARAYNPAPPGSVRGAPPTLRVWAQGHVPGFEALGGLAHVVQTLKEAALLPLVHGDVLQRLGIRAPRGILLHGVPGSGKTAAVRALAGECAAVAPRPVALFVRKGADCLGKFVGDAERTLRLLFTEAARLAPSIIFLDELDALAPARHVRENTQDQVHASVVSTLLSLMDGMTDRGQVLVIAATNRPDTLDPALRRPGRFDTEVCFTLPDTAGRAAILSAQTRAWREGRPCAALLQQLADATPGFAGADLQALCCGAVLAAARRVAPADWLACLDAAPATACSPDPALLTPPRTAHLAPPEVAPGASPVPLFPPLANQPHVTQPLARPMSAHAALQPSSARAVAGPGLGAMHPSCSLSSSPLSSTVSPITPPEATTLQPPVAGQHGLPAANGSDPTSTHAAVAVHLHGAVTTNPGLEPPKWLQGVHVEEEDWLSALAAAPPPASQRESLALLHGSGQQPLPHSSGPLVLPTLAALLRHVAQGLPAALAPAVLPAVAPVPADASAGPSAPSHALSAPPTAQGGAQGLPTDGSVLSALEACLVQLGAVQGPPAVLTAPAQLTGEAAAQVEQPHRHTAPPRAGAAGLPPAPQPPQPPLLGGPAPPPLLLLVCGGAERDLSLLLSTALLALHPASQVVRVTLPALVLHGRGDPAAGLQGLLGDATVRTAQRGAPLVLLLPDLQLWAVEGVTRQMHVATPTPSSSPAAGAGVTAAAHEPITGAHMTAAAPAGDQGEATKSPSNSRRSQDADDVACEATALWGGVQQSLAQMTAHASRPVLLLATCTLPEDCLPSEVLGLFSEGRGHVARGALRNDGPAVPGARAGQPLPGSFGAPSYGGVVTWQPASTELQGQAFLRAAHQAAAQPPQALQSPSHSAPHAPQVRSLASASTTVPPGPGQPSVAVPLEPPSGHVQQAAGQSVAATSPPPALDADGPPSGVRAHPTPPPLSSAEGAQARRVLAHVRHLVQQMAYRLLREPRLPRVLRVLPPPPAPAQGGGADVAHVGARADAEGGAQQPPPFVAQVVRSPQRKRRGTGEGGGGVSLVLPMLHHQGTETHDPDMPRAMQWDGPQPAPGLEAPAAAGLPGLELGPSAEGPVGVEGGQQSTSIMQQGGEQAVAGEPAPALDDPAVLPGPGYVGTDEGGTHPGSHPVDRNLAAAPGADQAPAPQPPLPPQPPQPPLPPQPPQPPAVQCDGPEPPRVGPRRRVWTKHALLTHPVVVHLRQYALTGGTGLDVSEFVAPLLRHLSAVRVAGAAPLPTTSSRVAATLTAVPPMPARYWWPAAVAAALTDECEALVTCAHQVLYTLPLEVHARLQAHGPGLLDLPHTHARQ